MEMPSIHFYSLKEAYGEFSNFAPYPIKIKGKKWPTSEHYFQGQKFAGTPQEEEIRKATRKWTMVIRDWALIAEQFSIIFGNRMKF